MNDFTGQTRIEIKKAAREKLQGNLLMPFLATLRIGAIIGAFSSGFYIKTEDGVSITSGSFSSILEVIAVGFMSFGSASYFLKFARKGETDLDSLFDGTKNIAACVISGIIITFITAIGFILLIVPGIYLALTYSMTYYILVDNPKMSATDAMKKSKEIMQGHKGDLLMLYLSFILWYLGVLFTIGILSIYLSPYMATTLAMFYDKINPKVEEKAENNTVSADDLSAFKSEQGEYGKSDDAGFFGLDSTADEEDVDDYDDIADDTAKKDDDIIF